MTRARGDDLDPHSVLAKVMDVLNVFTVEDRGIPLAELARRTGMPKGTLHRVAGDLVAAGLLDRTGKDYRLSGRLFELGMRASVERSLVDLATPFMEDLYELTHETVHLGVREDGEILYVAKIGGHRQADAPSRVGGRMPLHCTAIGKVLLACAPADVAQAYLAGPLERRAPRTITVPGLLWPQLERIAELGVGFEYEESAAGIVCVAAPVADAGGEVVAALSLTGPSTRFDPARHASQVQAAAAGLGAALARRKALRRSQH